jgi:hypothetical protein
VPTGHSANIAGPALTAVRPTLNLRILEGVVFGRGGAQAVRATGFGRKMAAPDPADRPGGKVCANSDILACSKAQESVFNPVAGSERLC